MSRRFDSLRQCVRAYELVRIWRVPVGPGCVGMPKDRIERTERAADYLWRRLMRHAPAR